MTWTRPVTVRTSSAGVPARLIQTVTGLVDVVEYLDAMRGKV